MGSPEKPLSDLGAVSYRSYWAITLLTAIKHFEKSVEQYRADHPMIHAYWGSAGHSMPPLNILTLSILTSILPEDIIANLTYITVLRPRVVAAGNSEAATGSPDMSGNNQAAKGRPGKMGQELSTGVAITASAAHAPRAYTLHRNEDLLNALIAQYTPVAASAIDKCILVKSDCLQWTPLYTVDYKRDKWSIRYAIENCVEHSLGSAGDALVPTAPGAAAGGGGTILLPHVTVVDDP